VWAAAEASANEAADYVRFLTYLALLSEGDGGNQVRACALVERFVEAREMAHSLLVLENIDQLCAGSGSEGYSSIMIAILRTLLRSPPASSSTAKAGGQPVHIKENWRKGYSYSSCNLTLHEVFDETIGRLSLLVASAAVFLLLTHHHLDCKLSLSYLIPTQYKSFCQMAKASVRWRISWLDHKRQFSWLDHKCQAHGRFDY
jgi:hypothetical protein